MEASNILESEDTVVANLFNYIKLLADDFDDGIMYIDNITKLSANLCGIEQKLHIYATLERDILWRLVIITSALFECNHHQLALALLDCVVKHGALYNQYSYAMAIHMLASIYLKRNEYSLALPLYDVCLKLVADINIYDIEVKSHLDLSRAYIAINDTNKAILHYESALYIGRKGSEKRSQDKSSDRISRLVMSRLSETIDNESKSFISNSPTADWTVDFETENLAGSSQYVFQILGTNDPHKLTGYHWYNCEEEIVGRLSVMYKVLGMYKEALYYANLHLECLDAKNRGNDANASTKAVGNTNANKVSSRVNNETVQDGKPEITINIISHTDSPSTETGRSNKLEHPGKQPSNVSVENSLLEAYANIGSIYLLLGEYRNAINAFETLAVLSRKMNKNLMLGAAYGSIGISYCKLGNYSLAIAYCEQQLHLSVKAADSSSQLDALLKLGDICQSSGELLQAINYYDKTLTLSLRTFNIQYEAYSKLMVVYFAMQHYVQAQIAAEQALRLAVHMSAYNKEVICKYHLSYIHCLQGHYNQSIVLLEEVIPYFLKQENTILYEAELMNCYRYVQEALIELNRIDDALMYAERYNSYKLIQFLKQKDEYNGLVRDNYTLTLPDILNATRSMSDDSMLLYYSVVNGYVYLWLISPKRDIVKFHRAKIDGLGYLCNIIHRYCNIGKSAIIVKGQGLNSNKSDLDINNETTNDKTVILNHSEDQEHLVMDSKQTTTDLIRLYYHCENRGLTENEVQNDNPEFFKRFYNRVNCNNVNTALKLMYSTLISPIQNDLDLAAVDHIVIISGKHLEFVPFTALCANSDIYMYEKYRISLTSCLLALQIANSNSMKHSTNEYISYEQPRLHIYPYNLSLKQFNPDEDNIRNRQFLHYERILVAGNPIFQHQLVKCDRVWKPVEPLPTSLDEVRQIGLLLNTTPLVGTMATKERILTELAKASVVHLSTVSCLYGNYLAFTPNPYRLNDDPTEEDAYLITSDDLKQLKLNAKIVVLSSCSTRSHRDSNNLHRLTYDLPNMLLACGVCAVVVPLWTSPDLASDAFWFHFYNNLYKFQRLSEALKYTIDSIRKDVRLVDPLCWAPYVLLGQDMIVDIKQIEHHMLNASIERQKSRIKMRLLGSTLSPRGKPYDEELVVPAVKMKEMQELLSELLRSYQHVDFSQIIASMLQLIDRAVDYVQDLKQQPDSVQISREIDEIPICKKILTLIGFKFQSYPVQSQNDYVIFPHWDVDGLLKPCQLALRSVKGILKSTACLFAISKLLPLDEKVHKCLIKLLHVSSSTYIDVNDSYVQSMWHANPKSRQLLLALGYHQAGTLLIPDRSKSQVAKDCCQLLLALLAPVTNSTKSSKHNRTSSAPEVAMEDEIILNSTAVAVDTGNDNTALLKLPPLKDSSIERVTMTSGWSPRRSFKTSQGVTKLAKRMDSLNTGFRQYTKDTDQWYKKQTDAQANTHLKSAEEGQSNETKVTIKVKAGSSPSCPQIPLKPKPICTSEVTMKQRQRSYQTHNEQTQDVTDHKLYAVDQLYHVSEKEL